MKHLSDQELMRIVQAGDFSPASEIYDRYSGRIYNFALRFLRNSEAAEDATQEVFVAPEWKVDGSLAYVRGNNETDNTALAQISPLEGRIGATYDNSVWSVGGLLRSPAPRPSRSSRKRSRRRRGGSSRGSYGKPSRRTAGTWSRRPAGSTWLGRTSTT